MKSECPTFLRSKGKVMAITLSDDKVVGKTDFVSHTKHTAEATNMNLFHL